MYKRKKHGHNEKKYSTTLKGHEKAKFEVLDVGFTDFVRVKIDEEFNSNEDKDILELKADLVYYQNKIHEKKLEIRAFESQLEDIASEIRRLKYNKSVEFIISKIDELFRAFESSVDGFDVDLVSDFYYSERYRYAIENIVRCSGLDCDDGDLVKVGMDIYDKYRISLLGLVDDGLMSSVGNNNL